jgi:hypothetical protein
VNSTGDVMQGNTTFTGTGGAVTVAGNSIFVDNSGASVYGCTYENYGLVTGGVSSTGWQSGSITTSVSGHGSTSNIVTQSSTTVVQTGVTLSAACSSGVSLTGFNTIKVGQVFGGFVYCFPTATQLEETKSARQTIDAFRTLSENWDGYGAAAISPMACDNARYFIDLIEAAPFGLPVPELSPTPAGTISFEWEGSHAEAYLEIGNTRYSGFIKIDHEQEPAFLQGYVECMGQKIIRFIQTAIAEPLTTSAPAITEIQTAWHEQLLAA